MSCTYVINSTGEKLTLWAFDDFLRAMEPIEAAKWMEGVNPVANPEVPRFSIRSSVEHALNETDITRNTLDFTDKMTDVVKNNVYALATQRQLADMAKKVLTAMPKYISERTAMDKTVEKIMQVSDKITKKWENLVPHSDIPFKDSTRKAQNRAEQKKLANAMHFATIYGQDPRVPYAGDPKNATERSNYNYVKKLYDALNSTAREVFNEVANDHKAHLEQIIAAEKANVEATTASREAKDKMLEELNRIMRETKIYFPLSRFGKYSVYYTQGDKKYFNMFESEGEMNRFVKNNPDIEVHSKGLSADEMKSVTGVSGQFLSSVNDLTAGISDDTERAKFKDSLYQLYLKSLPDMSARKHFMHRNKTPGFHEDALRGYASKAFHDARMIGRLEHSGKLEQLFKNMRQAVDAAKGPREMEKLTHKIDLLKALSDPAVANHPAGMDTEMHALYQDYLAREPKAEARQSLIEQDLANAEDIKDMAEKVDGEQVKYHRILKELELSHEAMMNPQTAAWASFLNSVGFSYYLGFSVSSAMVNGLQTPAMAMPYLAAKHGFIKSNAVLGRELKAFASGKDEDGSVSMKSSLTGERKRAFQELLDRGIITKTLAMDLIGLADEGVNAGSTRRKLMYAMAWAFNKVEVMNREITGMAAFDLEYAANGGDFEKAVNYADEVVNTAHGDYNPNNRPRIMRGNVSRVLTQFKQYSQFVTYNWAKAVLEATGVAKKKLNGEVLTEEDRQAVKLLANLVVAQGAMAGVMGLPIGGALVALQMIADLAGDPDDPYDVDEEIKALIYNYVPSAFNLNDALARGPFTAWTGVDFFSRMSQANMFFREPQKDLEGKYATQYLAETLAGPMGGMVQNIADFIKMWGDDYKEKAVEKLLPKALKDPLAALRIAREGATNMRGDVIQEIDAFHTFMKVVGFNDADLSMKYDINFIKSKVESTYKQRRTHLIDLAARAKLDNDNEAFNEIWNTEITHWNQVNPEPALRITKPQIMKSVRARRVTSTHMENGFLVNPKLAAKTDKYNFNGE